MGKVLQIRVTASTYDQREVKARWPRLCKLAFTPIRPKELAQGVLELAQSLYEQCRFGEWDKELTDRLKPGIDKAKALCQELEAALADWKASEANRISDELEDQLDRLEEIAPKD